jgi:hypothetical protein
MNLLIVQLIGLLDNPNNELLPRVEDCVVFVNNAEQLTKFVAERNYSMAKCEVTNMTNLTQDQQQSIIDEITNCPNRPEDAIVIDFRDVAHVAVSADGQLIEE